MASTSASSSYKLRSALGGWDSILADASRLPMDDRLRLIDELASRGQTARDLLDVHDFVWLTLRAAARKRIAAKSTSTGSDAKPAA